MISEDQLKKLLSENEFLQVQLQDVNEMIAVREEELELLREKARIATETKSRLETTYEELSYMQNLIGKQQQKAEGAARREASMEEEMLDSMRMEKEYYGVRDQFNSAVTALADIRLQLAEASLLYRQLADSQRKIAELESTVDIIKEEKELLQFELNKLKQKPDTKS
jgi:chromosome segregation ATPase